MSFIDCHGSFDGMAACGINDTVFAYNDASKKVRLRHAFLAHLLHDIQRHPETSSELV